MMFTLKGTPIIRTNLLLPHNWSWFCNDTILTSSGTARGGYLDVRSAARQKQHAAEQLFNNKLNQSFL